jgi:lipopolysaccharide/colanic/teichoic acid biosynthesis glycosyltransferase
MYPIAKRALDIVIALIAALVTLPFVIVVAILLWCAQRTVLFRQMRPGLNGRPFILYKFRSMSEERDSSGHPLPDYQRLTRVGSLVRSLSLDELPQLWNVLKGDMSIVGPRPLLMKYLPRYSAEQARRHEVKPGITGWAQVNGRNSLSWEEKFALDVWYVDHRSFPLDLQILLKTFRRVLTRHGISNERHATMPEFLGTVPSTVLEDDMHRLSH